MGEHEEGGGVARGVSPLLKSQPSPPLPTQLPEPAVAHLLRTAGFTSDDPLLTRLVAVATQRFAAAVAHDALQVERRRALRPGAAGGAAARRAGGGRRSVLAVEDLSEALQDVGVSLTRAPYLASEAAGGGGGGGGGGSRGRRKAT